MTHSEGDFGLAKPLPCVLEIGDGRVEASPFSYTMCGSPQFLAPEVFLNTGYNRSADWWSFGCVVFEMMTGHPPFEGALEDVYRKVVAIGLGQKSIRDSIPEELRESRIGNVYEDFIARLVDQEGSRLNDATVLCHRFFGHIDFAQLDAGQLPPPWRPSVSGPADDSFFPAIGDAHIRAVAAAEPAPEEHRSTFDAFGPWVDDGHVASL